MPERGEHVGDLWRPGASVTLRRLWDTARAGGSTTLLLRGDAGSGKSTLVAGLAADAAADGAFVLRGAAADVGEQLPLRPLAAALRALLGGGSPTAAHAAEALAPLLDDARALLDGTPAPGGEGALLDLVRRVVTSLAARAPVLLAVDDLQWADRTTREALTGLVAELVHEPVLLVVAVRAEAVVLGHPLRTLLPELSRHPRVSTLDLAPLDRPTVAAIVGRAAGGGDGAGDDGDWDGGVEPLVWARSGGNAFIVAETLRAVRDGAPRAVSATLRDLVLARIAPLDEAARAVVVTVAIGEEPVAHRVLAAVVGLPAATLNAALRAARDASLLVVDPATDGYALRHGLLRDVLAAELLPGERHEVHRRYAEALDAAAGSAVEPSPALVLARAHHWYLADDPDAALPALHAAARGAESRRDYATAHRQWSRVLEVLGRLTPAGPRSAPRALPSVPRALPVGTEAPETDRAALVAHAAEVAHLAGEHDRAVDLGRLVVAGGGLTPPDRGRDPAAVVRLGRFLLDAGRTGEAVEVLAAPGDGAGASDAPASLPAALYAARADALLLSGDVRRAREEAERALERSRAHGEQAEQAPILATLGFALAYLENPEAGLAAVAQGLRVAERTADAPSVGRAYHQWADLLTGPLQEIAEGVEVARQGVARMRDLGLARTHGVGLLALVANGLFRLGRWSEAQQAVDEAWAHRPAGAAALEIRLARVRLLLGRGELDAADEDLRAVELLSAGAAERRRVPLLTLRAGLQMWRRRPGEARELVAAGLDVAERTPDDVFLIAPLVWHGLRAEAEAAALGDRDPAAAARLVRLVDALTHRVPSTAPALRRTVDTYVRMCRAEISRVRGAPDPAAWKEVATAWSAQLHPYPAAYAQLRRADALLARRRGTVPGEARRCLAAAADAARAMGARPLLAEVADVAARAGLGAEVADAVGAPEGAAPSSPELSALTPREFEVLELVADGLSNRDIARALTVAERTVAVHVSHTLHKTGTRSRTQAAALLQRVRAR